VPVLLQVATIAKHYYAIYVVYLSS